MPPLDPGIQNWFRRADSDLLNIENNLAASSIPWDTVAYHSQQVGEKYLKAMIAFHEDLVPKIHDTVALHTICARLDPRVSPLRPDCEALNRFGGVLRYPSPLYEPTAEDAREMYVAAKRVRAEIRRLLGAD